MVKVAIVQESLVIFDRSATIEKAIRLIDEAASSGASLVVFPEAFISGYPAWIWRLKPGADWSKYEALRQKILDSAIPTTGDELSPLTNAAQKHGVTVVCGINEFDNQTSGGTLYNSVVTIDADGRIVNWHRKLMPTNPERMVWGFGDGSGLKVVNTAVGKLGSLICWESICHSRAFRYTHKASRSTLPQLTIAARAGLEQRNTSHGKDAAG